MSTLYIREMRTLITLALLCCSCHSHDEPRQGLDLTFEERSTKTGRVESQSVLDTESSENIISGEDLTIWSGVDTADEWNREAISALRRFFDDKMYRDDGGDFWLASDVEKYILPYSEIRYAEYDGAAKPRYLPSLMRIERLSQTTAKLTVKWAAKDSSGSEADVRYVYDFLAIETDEGMRLSQPFDHNTADWERRTFGQLTYVVSPHHTFSEEDALEQTEDIKRLSAFFDQAEMPIIFYSYADPADYFSALGFRLHPTMYTHDTGGRVDLGGHLHSANGRDIYTHEVAHLFSLHRFGERADLLEEGLATILGGSSEKSYAYHRRVLRDHLDAHPEMDLSQHLITYKSYHIEEDTNVPYIIGALLCEHIDRKMGRDSLFEMLASGPQLWQRLEEIGIDSSNVDRIVRAELEKEIAIKL